MLSDPLSEASLQLIAGSVVTSFGTVVIGNGAGDTGVRVTVPVLLPGQVLTVTFQARGGWHPHPRRHRAEHRGIRQHLRTGRHPARLPAPGDRAGHGIGADRRPARRPATPRCSATSTTNSGAFRQNTLNVPAILSGTAQPGATVALALRDANGAPISTMGMTADVGGHWVASPIPIGAGPQQDAAAFAEAVALAGRQSASGGGVGLAAAVVGAPVPTPVTAPYSVLTSESPASFDQRGSMDGVRVTFAGAVQPGGAFTGAPEAAGLVALAPTGAAVQREAAGLAQPGSLAWNRFALDFAASAAVAAAPGR